MPNLQSSLLEDWASAELTKTKTRTGAIAFRPPTNRSPMISSHVMFSGTPVSVISGTCILTMSAMEAPMIMPMRIRMKL